MGSQFFSLLLLSILLMLSTTANGNFAKNHTRPKMNTIDSCWRDNPRWVEQRQELAKCSVGFAGKMTNNIGKDVTNYVVTDPSDNPVNPKPGTLRYGVTMIKGKVWITFEKDMEIKLQQTLVVGSFTAIDGRGVNVQISNGGCLFLYKVTNVIIHGLEIHHCQHQPAGQVMGPDSKLIPVSETDGDAIRLVGSTKVWVDHNTLYTCKDGLIDVTLGSTDITISNNWFRDHDKVMLLGHDDAFEADKNMKVTVVFNRFGPNCNQRMPRVRHGYAHVANNLYLGWEIYAIGGSMNPTVKSESNLFVALKSGTKEIIRTINKNNGEEWNFQSVGDVLENGASFREVGTSTAKPNYDREQIFTVANAKIVRQLTSAAGILHCRIGFPC